MGEDVRLRGTAARTSERPHMGQRHWRWRACMDACPGLAAEQDAKRASAGRTFRRAKSHRHGRLRHYCAALPRALANARTWVKTYVCAALPRVRLNARTRMCGPDLPKSETASPWTATSVLRGIAYGCEALRSIASRVGERPHTDVRTGPSEERNRIAMDGYASTARHCLWLRSLARHFPRAIANSRALAVSGLDLTKSLKAPPRMAAKPRNASPRAPQQKLTP